MTRDNLIRRARENYKLVAFLPPDSREAMGLAAAVAADLLQADGAPDALVTTLHGLQVALLELDRGVVHPALVPAIKRGRPAISRQELAARAYLAAALDVAMRAGKKRDVAAREIADKAIVDPTNPKMSASQGAKLLSGWRDGFVNGAHADTVAQSAWERGRAASAGDIDSLIELAGHLRSLAGHPEET